MPNFKIQRGVWPPAPLPTPVIASVSLMMPLRKNTVEMVDDTNAVELPTT